LFKDIIDKPQWIIEDAGRKCFSEGMEKADIIIYLKPSVWVRKNRIITRNFKQKFGLEDCLYTPNLRMFRFMFRALNNYESRKDDLENTLSQYKHKTITFKKNKEINEYLLNL
jgi:adenylate kinase family enzyme